MQLPTDEAALTALFERHGARDAQAWAASQVREGINQWHRFMYLKQAWSTIVPADHDGWIDRLIAQHEKWPQRHDYRLGATLKRLLDQGAVRADLVDLVRSLLSDPSLDDPALAGLGWRLVEADKEGRPTSRTIDALHESVLETGVTLALFDVERRQDHRNSLRGMAPMPGMNDHRPR